MKICMTGLDDVQAPIELREQLSFTKSAAAELDRRMVELGCRGAVVLSTCNRTEVYLSLTRDRISIPGRCFARPPGFPPACLTMPSSPGGESTAPAI